MPLAVPAALFLLGLGLALVLLRLGARARPEPMPPPSVTPGAVEHVALPEGLPRPVDAFYRTLYGERVPVYRTAILTGRGTLRLRGITLQTRLRFTHETGRAYRHEIEATFFGHPIIKVDERFVDGRARFAFPTGVLEDDPDLDGAANQGLWAETLTYPAAYLTDPRVRWEPIDDDAALLRVPFRDGDQVLTVHFDPQTRLATRIEADRRYADASRGYVRWRGTVDAWSELGGVRVPVRQSARWADQDRPWLELTLEDVVFNADVAIRMPEGSAE